MAGDRFIADVERRAADDEREPAPVAPLSDQELDRLRRLDGPPPLETVTISRVVHPLAMRAVREIGALRAKVAELEGAEAARAAGLAMARSLGEAERHVVGELWKHMTDEHRLALITTTGDAGAARGALEAADELGLRVGGWTAATGLPEIYAERLKPTLAPRMAARLNVQDSDGTLIISFAPGLLAGSPAAYADEAVEHQRKPSLHIVLPDGGRSAIPEDVRKGVLAWIAEEKIATLHVTGPREADDPGIQQAVRDALVWIFEDEVMQPSPRARAFAERTIGPMIDETFGFCDDIDEAAMRVDAAIAAGLEVEIILPDGEPRSIPASTIMPSEPLRADDYAFRNPPLASPEVYAARDQLLAAHGPASPGVRQELLAGEPPSAVGEGDEQPALSGQALLEWRQRED